MLNRGLLQADDAPMDARWRWGVWGVTVAVALFFLAGAFIFTLDHRVQRRSMTPAEQASYVAHACDPGGASLPPNVYNTVAVDCDGA